MHQNHFVTSRLPTNDGYTWTLASRLGHMLARCEEQFGPRDNTYAILGIEFGPDPVPHTWFPGSRNHVLIQLAPNAIDDEVLACYQLAHECVHLLAPTGTAGANILEEGLATVFSENYILSEFQRAIPTYEQNYAFAAAMVRHLLSKEPDAIPRLRRVEPCFSKMTPKVFAAAGLQIPSNIIDQLLAPFAPTS
jgi:hypothetical protein